MSDMHFPLHLVLDEVDWDPQKALPVGQALDIEAYTLRMIHNYRYPHIPRKEHNWLEDLHNCGACRFDVISPGINKTPFCAIEVERLILKEFPLCIAAAQRIGASVISLFSWAKTPTAAPPLTPGGLSPSAPLEAIATALHIIADLAASAGLTISVEVGYQCWGDTGLATAQILKAANHPALHMLWDPCNSLAGRVWWARHTSPPPPQTEPMQTLTAELDQIANLISEVHVRDLRLSPTTWEYVFIGKGQVDWSVLMRALWDHGYRGPLTIEHHIPAPNKEAATCHTAHFLKQQIPQMKNA